MEKTIKLEITKEDIIKCITNDVSEVGKEEIAKMVIGGVEDNTEAEKVMKATVCFRLLKDLFNQMNDQEEK